jgi:hypothetical protein
LFDEYPDDPPDEYPDDPPDEFPEDPAEGEGLEVQLPPPILPPLCAQAAAIAEHSNAQVSAAIVVGVSHPRFRNPFMNRRVIGHLVCKASRALSDRKFYAARNHIIDPAQQ